MRQQAHLQCALAPTLSSPRLRKPAPAPPAPTARAGAAKPPRHLRRRPVGPGLRAAPDAGGAAALQVALGSDQMRGAAGAGSVATEGGSQGRRAPMSLPCLEFPASSVPRVPSLMQSTSPSRRLWKLSTSCPRGCPSQPPISSAACCKWSRRAASVRGARRGGSLCKAAPLHSTRMPRAAAAATGGYQFSAASRSHPLLPTSAAPLARLSQLPCAAPTLPAPAPTHVCAQVRRTWESSRRTPSSMGLIGPRCAASRRPSSCRTPGWTQARAVGLSGGVNRGGAALQRRSCLPLHAGFGGNCIDMTGAGGKHSPRHISLALLPHCTPGPASAATLCSPEQRQQQLRLGAAEPGLSAAARLVGRRHAGTRVAAAGRRHPVCTRSAARCRCTFPSPS